MNPNFKPSFLDEPKALQGIDHIYLDHGPGKPLKLPPFETVASTKIEKSKKFSEILRRDLLLEPFNFALKTVEPTAVSLLAHDCVFKNLVQE